MCSRVRRGSVLPSRARHDSAMRRDTMPAPAADAAGVARANSADASTREATPSVGAASCQTFVWSRPTIGSSPSQIRPESIKRTRHGVCLCVFAGQASSFMPYERHGARTGTREMTPRRCRSAHTTRRAEKEQVHGSRHESTGGRVDGPGDTRGGGLVSADPAGVG